MSEPVITAGHFEEIARLLDGLIEEKQALFVERLDQYRRQHREVCVRPLNPVEAMQLTAGLAGDLDVEQRVAFAERIQQSELRSYDPPAPLELQLAAGVALFPATLDVLMRLVALIEMSYDDIVEADDELPAAIGGRAKAFRSLEASEFRGRAEKALEAWSAAAGSDVREGLGTALRVVTHAMRNALQSATDEAANQGTTLVVPDGGVDVDTLVGEAA